jgi:2-oxoglutarate ferredoxin oxidoreductase subunit gamma
MRHEETIFSGFGGQGALFAGQLLAYTGIAEELYVTWIPSYGPEMRGGTAHCIVIVSDEEIGAPIIKNPTAAVVLNLPSMEKYEPLVKPDGLLVVNSSLIEMQSERDDIDVLYVPASDIATELGNPRMANVVLLGAFIEKTGLVSLETVEEQLTAHLSERQRKWLEPNKEALHKGAALAREA